MTTTTLSPTERDEVHRFGIHDEDVLRGMEERFDESVPCRHCDAPAVWRSIMTCCGAYVTSCDPHEKAWEAGLDRLIRAARGSVVCADCSHRFPLWPSVTDMVRVVAL